MEEWYFIIFQFWLPSLLKNSKMKLHCLQERLSLCCKQAAVCVLATQSWLLWLFLTCLFLYPTSTWASRLWCIRLLYLIFCPHWNFLVSCCSFLHFTELNSRQVRRISQISSHALASYRETIKPWNMCLAVSLGDLLHAEWGTSVHRKHKYLHWHKHIQSNSQ